MNKGRLEAFSDGVMAIIITIMVLELKAPEDTAFSALMPLIPVFISYVLSFIYIGIYWINHHHLLQITSKVNGRILWANLIFLFWLSLIPFATSWMDENLFEPAPVASYGAVLLLCALSYKLLETELIKYHDKNYLLLKIIKGGWKENTSIAVYITAILLAYIHSFISLFCYAFVAALWFFPSRKLEKLTNTKEL